LHASQRFLGSCLRAHLGQMSNPDWVWRARLQIWQIMDRLIGCDIHFSSNMPACGEQSARPLLFS
jgi:hypothetical protein